MTHRAGRQRAARGALAVALLLAASACRRGRNASADSAGTDTGALATPMRGAAEGATLSTSHGPVAVRGDSAPGAVAVAAEPLDWTGDAVVSRLAEAGLGPSVLGTFRQPPIGPPGLRVSVASGAAEVRAFIFGDADAVGRATANLDLGQFSAPGRPATLTVDNNLAAIILTGDERLRERIRFALVARRGEGR